ncbi:MAG: hypothetical protein ACM3MD_08110 [Betaproteobacteria bacterium]
MREVKFFLNAMAVIIIGVIGFVYWAPEKATSFAINANRSYEWRVMAAGGQ